MFLHIGLDKLIEQDTIVGIYDLDTSTVSRSTRNYLAKAEKAGEVENVCVDLPKSFIVCNENGRRKIYISQLSVQTLLRRVNSRIGY